MIKYHYLVGALLAIAFGAAHSRAAEDADALERRGSDLFRAGKFAESVAAFDEEIRLEPRRAPWHWKRGISLYYAGRYADGAKQFEGYQTVDDNDVENAVWRYLCQVRAPTVGPEKARSGILPIKNDGRVPMMQIYSMFRGEAQPDDVLAACRGEGISTAEREHRLFYAHLYLGLFHDAHGRKSEAIKHMSEAKRLRIAHYMGDVAVVHADLLVKNTSRP
ncbi:MAG: tetratricopeptide repeat protein [Planctomycetales bacterium]|nr:tetratricopeptide repeat protein [Planctomycetales bacterium]MBN8624348.1 tetratricopeptide repeat protein [Planctomycetota bacterium]